MQEVLVKLAERSYPIFIGTKSLGNMAGELADSIGGWSHAILVCDKNIVEHIGKAVEANLSLAGKRTTLLVVPSGEENKSVARLSVMWDCMLEAKSDRKSVVLAIGGGVVGDLAGFAAATFARGLRFIQIPTTLLAMVDSSVGGKTGINLPAAKNMIGAFWQPRAVWIDTSTLDSLPEREFLSGMAEVVKYGVILDAAFFDYLEQHADAILARNQEQIEFVVRRSCELKANVVSEDELETTGLRAILNYGHTFGHAIEATTSYGRFLHGEAIAIGMTMAGELASRMGLWSDRCQRRQNSLLRKFGLPTHFTGVPAEKLVEAMQMDKKTEHGKLKFILPTRIGHVSTVSNCRPADIVAAIQGHEAL